MANEATKLQDALDRVKKRVKASAERVGRNPADITIVAITKTVDVGIMRILADLGWSDIGENRVADALEKAQAFPENHFTWHMVGHLQTNKVKKAVPLFEYVHSVDSFHLAEAIHKEAKMINKSVKALIEVNVSGELSKSGIKPEELFDLYSQAKGMIEKVSPASLTISGLMTMAPITDNPETTRPYFRKLRELWDDLRNRFPDSAGELKYLSMGMTQDFEVAVEEGANLLRIGTAIFEPVR